MKAAPRTVALIGGAMAVLVAPLIAVRGWSDPPDPRILVGAAAPATLLPGDVRDPAGRMIAGAVWTGLVALDPRTGAPVNAAAASVTSGDRRVWTVRLKPGGRFHDGSPVTAESFIGAWTAVVREGWHGARHFTEIARVKGSRQAAGGTADGGTAGKGKVAGLAAVRPDTIRITLDRPFNGFPALLADPAFLPMPEWVLRSRDWRSYERRPVGNGPYQVRGRDARQVILARAGAPGTGIVVKAMPAARQYAAARAGDLDVATQVPGARHGSMDDDFPRRHLTVPGREMTYLAFPLWDRRYAATSLRHAVSLAIDRAAVTEGPLGQQATAATSLIPPGIALGRRSGVCRICVHDNAAAGVLLADAGAPPAPVTLWYETSAGDERWVPLLARQLRAALRLDVRPHPAPAGRYGTAVADRTVDGPFVVHTTAAYPSAVAALDPLVAAPTGYRDRYAADRLAAAARSARLADGVIPARLAESALLRDLPLVPLWSAHDHLAWSARTRGVTADAFGGLRLDRLSLKK